MSVNDANRVGEIEHNTVFTQWPHERPSTDGWKKKEKMK